MMDRSKPLPIHEFPSLIDEVARLKELAAKDAPGTFSTEAPETEMQYMVKVLNAAPKLLDVLDFRAGDAEKLAAILENYCLECDDHVLIDRYRGMAQAMEGKP